MVAIDSQEYTPSQTLRLQEKQTSLASVLKGGHEIKPGLSVVFRSRTRRGVALSLQATRRGHSRPMSGSRGASEQGGEVVSHLPKRVQ